MYKGRLVVNGTPSNSRVMLPGKYAVLPSLDDLEEAFGWEEEENSLDAPCKREMFGDC